MKLYNTLTRTKEELKPLNAPKVTMYVCGVTVYDHCHLGHARAYVCFDLLRRYLEYQGLEPEHVQNFTDIDDKIIARAGELETTEDIASAVKALTEKHIDGYFDVMDALGIKRAHAYPKATENIQGMVTMIEGLITKGFAYENGGDVFFEVAKFKDYGKLSGKHLEDLQAGQRVEVDPRKKSPLDFVLWKASKPGEPAWPSPWGEGRPGWHIECSVMSLAHFGGTFDIHGGGCDLVFPHHENEIAQSEAHEGQAFARHWIHNGFLTIDKEKMSKSLGNFFTLKDILQKFSPESVRMFLLSGHYRSPLDFSDERLVEANEQLERGYMMLKNAMVKLMLCADAEQVQPDVQGMPELKALHEKFIQGMDDDLNSAIAIACLYEIVNLLNPAIAQKSPDLKALCLIKSGLELFKEIASVLCLFQKPRKVVMENQSYHNASEQEIQDLLIQRKEARKAKDWAKADELRDRILGLYPDMELEDTPLGSIASSAHF